ncbi:MAG: hypothetical protein AB7J35_02405 [Dehalococcoidia bacterium]
MILDHVDRISTLSLRLDMRHRVERRLNELAEGLQWLAEEVKMVEESVIERARTEYGPEFTLGQDIQGIPRGRVMSAFHWYAVSVCNYSGVVAWVAFGEDKKKRDAYRAQVLPIVCRWRDKVAAHYGFLSPRDPENLADHMTFLSPLTLSEKGFTVGGWTTRRFGPSGVEESQGLTGAWSLTAVHDELRPRYWPWATVTTEATS